MTRPQVVLALALVLFVGAPMAAQDSTNAASYNTVDGVAIKGYDPVAYFTMEAAVPGDPAISAEYDGVTFHFSSEEHRELFAAEPERYAPAYGGWCAWAASRDSLADIDPTQWVIHNDRLFLNFSGFVNTRFRLRLDHNIAEADRNWPDLAEEASSR
mgnify:CR=1 FL=1